MINNAPLIPDYDPLEERINYLSHGVGAVLALIAGIFNFQTMPKFEASAGAEKAPDLDI